MELIIIKKIIIFIKKIKKTFIKNVFFNLLICDFVII